MLLCWEQVDSGEDIRSGGGGGGDWVMVGIALGWEEEEEVCWVAREVSKWCIIKSIGCLMLALWM